MLTAQKAAVDDGMDIYRFLQELPVDENGFINSAAGKTYEERLVWLNGGIVEKVTDERHYLVIRL